MTGLIGHNSRGLIGGSPLSGGGGGGGSNPGDGYSTEAAQFLNRAYTTGTDPGATRKNEIAAVIDNIVADGDWTAIYALHMYDNDIETAQLANWKSSSFTAVKVGTGTLTADSGWVGDGTTGYLNPGFNPSTGFASVNGGTINVYQATSRGASGVALWGATAAAEAYGDSFYPKYDTNSYSCMHDGNFASVAQSDAQGDWALNRTSSTSTSLFNFKVGTTPATLSVSAVTRPNLDLYIGADNFNGTARRFTTDHIVHSLIGDLSSAALIRVKARLNAWHTSRGTNIY